MRVNRSDLIHRLAALAAGLGFTALTLGGMAWLHLAEHRDAHDSHNCLTCVSLSGHAKQIDPGTAVEVQLVQAVSEPARVAPETPILASRPLGLSARSPPLSFPG